MSRHLPVAAATVVAVALAGCTGGHPRAHSGTPAAGAGNAIKSGSAVLDLDGRVVRLPIQRCIGSDAHQVNLTAYDLKTKATLVVNIADPVSASTLVYTTREAHNAFTNYALASTLVHGAITGGVHGTQVSLNGRATRQSYRPDGKAAGQSSPAKVSLDAACRAINPPQPAPSYGKPTHRKEARTRPHGSATR